MKITILPFLAILFLSACHRESTVNPSDERELYPAECDYSPIMYGSIKIYSADTQFIKSIDVDYGYVPSGTYFVMLPNGTYGFEVESDRTDHSSFHWIELNSGERAVDLEACE